MGIKVKSSPRVNRVFEKLLQEKINKLKHRLIAIGRLAVETAVNNGNYQNHTMNLRNSNGFIVVYEGKVVHQEFKRGKAGKKSKDVAISLVSEYPEGLALIFTNGMEYAAYVESRGYDVVTSAKKLVERLTPIMLKQ